MRSSFLLLIALSACVDPSVGRDRDGDGFFTAELDGEDCDDSNANVNPDETEVCGNGIDDNCDGVVDDSGVGDRTWFIDSDRDGFAGPTEFTGCTAPAGAFADLSLGEDCDDTRSDINPGEDETWYDGVDQDCAGDNDNDADGDGFDAVSQGGDDCVDDNDSVNPVAVEVCNNGVDDDCDGGPNHCEYAGEVDLEGMASTVFGTESSKQWLDDFNGDGEADVLLQVDRRTSTRNRLELYLGPFQSFESEPDTVIWGPEGSDWSRQNNLVHASGDYNGDGATDIVVAGSYPEEEGSSLRIFQSPFPTGDLDDGDESVMIEWVSEASQRLQLRTDLLSAAQLSTASTADSLLWHGRPNLSQSETRVLTSTELVGVVSLTSSTSIDAQGMSNLPARLSVGQSTPTVLLGDSSSTRTLARVTLNVSNGTTTLAPAAWTSAIDSPFVGSLIVEGRWDLEGNSSIDMLVGAYALTTSTGEFEGTPQPPRIISGTESRTVSVVAIPSIAHIPETFGIHSTLAACDLTGDVEPEHIESLEFYIQGQLSVPAFQTIRWSSFSDSTTAVGEWDVDTIDTYIWNARCADDGRNLFASEWSGSTFLIPPIGL